MFLQRVVCNIFFEKQHRELYATGIYMFLRNNTHLQEQYPNLSLSLHDTKIYLIRKSKIQDNWFIFRFMFSLIRLNT